MREGLTWVAALLVGGVLGAFFFGLLRWTVRRALASAHPARWFAASMVLRLSVVLFGFYLVGQGHWERFVLCVLGFVLAKFVLVGWSAPVAPVEVSDAP